jgi:hypothetical protein
MVDFRLGDGVQGVEQRLRTSSLEDSFSATLKGLKMVSMK